MLVCSVVNNSFILNFQNTLAYSLTSSKANPQLPHSNGFEASWRRSWTSRLYLVRNFRLQTKKKSSLNDVTQFWIIFKRLPSLSCFLIIRFLYCRHRILDPSSLISVKLFIDDPKAEKVVNSKKFLVVLSQGHSQGHSPPPVFEPYGFEKKLMKIFFIHLQLISWNKFEMVFL